MNTLYKTNYFTPLRYPGGKSRFSPFIKRIYNRFDLINGDYAEVYAGGAGVALDLLISGFCKNIHINDADPAIYYFWHTLVNDTQELINLIQRTPITVEEWEKQKYILENPKKFSELEQGFSTFFLNRTNHSGILKGGMIGGKKQKGNYKLDARFNKKNLIKRIEVITNHIDHIYVYNLDAIDFLRKMDAFLDRKSLIYLDPPYYVKGQGLYRNFYNHSDHVDIMNLLSQLQKNWIVSYDNCDEITDIYKNFTTQEYNLNYSANLKKKGSEIVIFCNNLKSGRDIKII